jgi:hypothetical protein
MTYVQQQEAIDQVGSSMKKYAAMIYVVNSEQLCWPFGFKQWPGRPSVVKGFSCQELT